jgi:di/tricarboxylate transporter
LSLAWISLSALALAVALSCTAAINVGLLSLCTALLVGVYLADLSAATVLDGFPVTLLVTLVGVTLLFSIAETNGTLSRLTARAVRLCRGRPFWLPLLFFLLGLGVSTIGAGTIAGAALLAPPAMAVAGRAGVPPLLMAVMTGNGILAGGLSPFAPTGIVANGVMERIGLGGVEWQTFAYTALAHAIVGSLAFALFGGHRLIAQGGTIGADVEAGRFESPHVWTTGAILILIVVVVGFGGDVGMTALLLATVLILLRVADEGRAIRGIPWGVLLMVTGVSTLVALVESTEGLDLFASGLAQISTPQSIVPIAAAGTGIVSVYSSTSGVVLPAFLPMVPELVLRLEDIAPLQLAWAMVIGSSLVDLSSLSTVGALFLAAAAPGTNTRRLFNALLAWGLSMALVAPMLCWLLFG